MSDWSQDVDSMVFSLIKARFSTKLKTKYPNIRFTNQDSSGSSAKFPTVKIKLTTMNERGQDLENTSINAVDAIFQVDVMTNISQSEANEVMTELLSLFKALRFNISTIPILSKEGDIYRSTMRCRRIIGSNDLL